MFMAASQGPHDTMPADAGPQMPTVHLVDDDAAVRSALARLLASHSYRVRSYAGADEFLASFEKRSPCCLLLDVAMPGMGGLELRGRLAAAGACPPTIFMSGLADIPTCARAMRAGAIHFLQKPIDEAELLQALDEAVRHDTARCMEQQHQSMVASRLASLTAREREVLTHVMQGRLNKQIAADLGTAEKTVKVHRARAMDKMGIRSVAQLVRMVERAHLDAAEMATKDVSADADTGSMPLLLARAKLACDPERCAP
jgi:FixJ family two-component response regulator